jgi:1-acyl-sn-glycerol-3-phosphate acyltransferase
MPEIKSYRVAWWRRWIGRPLVRLLLGSLFRILAPIKITGKKNIPFGKPYIVAFNHVSLYDPPIRGRLLA